MRQPRKQQFLFSGIAVGTAVAGGPPRRSVREELPHTAPALSLARYRARLGVRVICHDSGAVSGTERPLGRFSWLGSFPPPTPPTLQLRLCSPASQVLRTHLTSRRRSSQRHRHGRFLSDPTGWRLASVATCRIPTGSPGSRAWNFDACTGSPTPPRPDTPRHFRRI